LFEYVYSFRTLLYFVVGIIGILVGVEIPILLRILKDRFEFKDFVSKVFTFDYIGALFASILFPLVLVPYLGLVKSSFLFGILNILVAIWVLYAIKEDVPASKFHKISAITVLIFLMFGFVYSEKIINFSEDNSYQGKIIFSQSTPYQRIVITKQADDLRLFLNSNLQFSSYDEYRYHEALVHPIMSAISNPRRVLIIGGGDGLALREVLKYKSVETVTLVDLDPEMTKLFSSNEILTNLNQKSLLSSKLTIINRDAFLWLREIQKNNQQIKYDAVIIDVPDPSNFSVGKLYSLTFFKLLHQVTHQKSLVVVQSTSPLVARKSFWCINNTLEAAGFLTKAYHTYVPSFGEWGYVIASNTPYQQPESYPQNLRYLNAQTADDMFRFPLDMAKVATKIQRLDDQVLVRYFDEEWSKYLIY
jgi:spermidine synthase